MQAPLISIIIPVYNVKAYLARCVDSVLSQTYTALEILLIDDGSTDGSGEICDEYAKKDPRIKVVHITNDGVSAARNLGLSKATGEYIGFVDSDDEIHPRMYEILYDISQKYQADVVACKSVRKVEQCQIYTPKELQILTKEEDILCYIMTASGVIWNKLYRRACIGKQFFNTKIGSAEDTLWSVRVSGTVKKFVISTDSLYIHYMVDSSITHSPRISRWIYEYKAWKQILAYAKRKHFAKAQEIALTYWMNRSFYLMTVLLLCDPAVRSKKHNALFKRILLFFSKNPRLVRCFSLRRDRAVYRLLSFFPTVTVRIARLPSVRKCMNKMYHFNDYTI